MKKIESINKIIILMSIIFTVFGCTDDNNRLEAPLLKPDIEFYGLTASNQLVKYNAAQSDMAIGTTTITGVAGSEKIIAIDFRPATGQLYGLSNGSKIYTINYMTGAASMVGTTAFTPALNGTIAGFDFNPTVDRIRLVTSSGQNLRLNPETGAVAATDGPLNPGTPNIGAVAYTNNVAGASTTTLFNLDFATNKLYKQDPPNNGSLVEVGSLFATATSGMEGGFDISSDNMVALATFMEGGNSNLYQINTTGGVAVNLGKLNVPLIGLAIPTAPVAYAIDNANNLHIFNFNNVGTTVSKAITGMQAGENILGIDMRPATGQLYALGSTSRMYTINMSSGAATVVGTAPFATVLAGSNFGFDFNPTVDRVRVVSDMGQNLRLNPNDGTIAAVDLALNPGTPRVSAAAYTNNFAGATTTVLFDIDATTDKLYSQVPPNNGTLVETGNLGINIEANNGFDITGISGKAYGLFTVGGVNKIYSINLTSGQATELSTFPFAAKGFAVGLGF